MPCPNDNVKVGCNYPANLPQLIGRITIIMTQSNRIKPKFTYHSFPLYVNVHWFATVKAVEEKTIRAKNAFDCWH